MVKKTILFAMLVVGQFIFSSTVFGYDWGYSGNDYESDKNVYNGYESSEACATMENTKYGNYKDGCYRSFAFMDEDPLTVEYRTKFFTNYFAIPGIVLFLAALIIVRVFWRSVLETFVFVHAIIAMPLISLGRYYFNVEDVSWIGDGDGNIHTLLWLLFALMCLYGVNVGLSGVFRSLKEGGEQFFSEKLKKTCVITGIYTVLISAVNSSAPESFVLADGFSSILFFGIAFLAVVGIWFIYYGVRARALLTDPGLRKWVLFVIGLGIAVIIAGGGPLILIVDFLFNGDITIM